MGRRFWGSMWDRSGSSGAGSEEGRVGEEGRFRWVPDHLKKKKRKRWRWVERVIRIVYVVHIVMNVVIVERHTLEGIRYSRCMSQYRRGARVHDLLCRLIHQH